MRDWRAYVRERLHLPAFTPEREAEAIGELALQLEDVARHAMSAGAREEDACAIAEQHVTDWARLAAEIVQEGRPHTRPLDSRLSDHIDSMPSPARWQRLTSGLAGDLLYGVRVLRTHRGFTLTAALTLALGIGTTAALFSIVDAVLLRPLPFRDPDQLVRLTSLRADGTPGGISYPDFLDWGSRSGAFNGMAVYGSQDFALRGVEGVSRVRGAAVSADLFTILGAAASLGRTFIAAEYAPGEPTAVVLGDRLWRERFGADPSLVGRTIELDHRPALVVGVMAPGFEFPIQSERAELWTTIAVGEGSMASQRSVHYLRGIARLAAGASLEQAQAELSTIVSALNRQYPENEPRGVRVRPELAELVADVRSQWLVLFGAAGCLLLIACVNVVNMLLARAASRRKELAVRFALGAGRGRLVRQLLAEHALLGALGAGLGLVFAYWCITLLKQIAPATVPRLAQAGLNGGVLAFAVAASLAAVVLFGLMPASHASTQDPSRLWSLAGRGRDDEAGGRIRRVLVIAQISIAMVLLVGGALLIRTLVGLQRVDPGFSAARIVTFRVDLPDEYPPARERTFYEGLLERLRAMPGIRDASAAFAVPLGGRDINTSTEIEGRPVKSDDHNRTNFNVVQPGLFQTLGVGLAAGRDFTAHDDLDSTPVAIVNEAFARRFFADVNPLGRRIRPGIGNGYPREPIREIVGVVQDVRSTSLRTAPDPEISVPAAQCPSFGNSIVVVRTDFEPQGFARDASQLVASLERSASVSRVRTLEQYISSTIVEPRFNSLLLGMFAVLSSTLAVIGLYGLISYTVAQRRQEFGVRLALGAAPRCVLGLVLRQGAVMALAGIGVGLVAGLALTVWMTSLLYGVGPRDPITFAGVACLLFSVAMAACAIPAARAMRVDPITALRQE
jgi:putative ABC transport system permease protein